MVPGDYSYCCWLLGAACYNCSHVLSATEQLHLRFLHVVEVCQEACLPQNAAGPKSQVNSASFSEWPLYLN